MGTTKVEQLNRLVAAKGGSAVGETICDCVKNLAKTIDDVDVPATVVETADALKWWADVLTGTCVATVAVKDSITTEAVASPTIVIKKGSTVGSGATVTPAAGKYSLLEGAYNYSVSASGYETKTGTFTISEAQVIAGVLTLEIELVAT